MQTFFEKIKKIETCLIEFSVIYGMDNLLNNFSQTPSFKLSEIKKNISFYLYQILSINTL